MRDDLSQSTVRGYERIIRCYIDPSVGRNRAKILQVARTAFAQSDADVSMAEISRRAGVGMATLYRNFPDRRELLEALYTDEVDAVCEAAKTSGGRGPERPSSRGSVDSSHSPPANDSSPPSCSRTRTAPTPSSARAAPEYSKPGVRCSSQPSARTRSAVTSRSNRLCLGAMMFGAFGNTDHDDCVRIIRRALDAGINFIDTADGYELASPR